MKNLPLLVDSYNFIPRLVEDKTSDGGKMIVRGEFARAGKPTENGRIYPLSLWEREIKRLTPQMEARKVLGEADHPESGRTSLKNASHLLTKLWLENDILMGEAELLDTTAGRDIKAIIEAAGQLGVSSRGFGTTVPNNEGKDVVQDNYRAITFDFVADPANVTSYPSVHTEDKEVKLDDKKMDIKETKDIKRRVAPPATETAMKDKLTLEGLKKSDPTLYENIMDDAEREYERRGAKIWAAKLEAEKAATSTDLKSVFAENLKAAIEAATAEVAAQERDRLMNDPTVAAAKSALESVKSILRPFIVPEDVESVVKSKEIEISALNKKIAEHELVIANLRNENGELAAVAKEAGYKYHLESLLAGNPHAVTIRKGVGDVKQYENVQALDEKIVDLVDALDKVQIKQEERDLEIDRLNKENKLLREATEKALEATKVLQVMTYAEERLRHHPKADQVRLVLEAKLPESKAEVDSILLKLRDKKFDASTLEEARARVRRLTKSNTFEYIQEDKRSDLVDNNSGNVDYNGLGTSADTLRALSGMGAE